MKQAQVLSKLESMVKEKRENLLRSASNLERRKDDVQWARRRADENRREAARLSVRNVTDLTYLKTQNYFQNYKNSCGFNAETFLGHSYNWYILTKRIKGTVILNSYGYSNQTAKHVSKVRSVLRDLGVSFKEVSAPRGLQDLNRAAEYAMEKLGEALVSNKYARIKTPSDVTYWKNQLKLVRSLGGRVKPAYLKKCVAIAESERESRNERARERRERKKMAERITSASNAKQSPYLQLVQGE